jgi:signal transduction histidine kinase
MDQNITLLFIAILNMVTAIFSWRTHQSQAKSAYVIKLLEKNTNSIKDALVKATGEAAFSAGETKGREAGEAKAQNLLDKGK